MRLIRLVHAWAGAVLALLLVLLGLTGSTLVLKNDYLRWTMPEARASVPATPQTLGRAADAVEAVHGGHVQRMVFAGPELGIHQLYFGHEGYGYAAADGRMIAQWQGPDRLETWVYELHHFLLSGASGMTVAGVAGLCAAVLALSGLAVWAPGWRAFRPRPWPRSTRRGELVTAHRNIGVLFALPVIFFCLTGAALTFDKTAQRLFTRLAPGPAAEEFFPPATPGDIDWPSALANAQAQFPKARLRMILWPAHAISPAIVRLKQPGEWAPEGDTAVMIDPATSAVLGVVDGRRLGPGQRFYDALYPLHTAFTGGRPYDVLAGLSGLALVALGGLGLWSFGKRQMAGLGR